MGLTATSYSQAGIEIPNYLDIQVPLHMKHPMQCVSTIFTDT